MVQAQRHPPIFRLQAGSVSLSFLKRYTSLTDFFQLLLLPCGSTTNSLTPHSVDKTLQPMRYIPSRKGQFVQAMVMC